jgi:PAS domain S-box-containing protein
LLHSLLDNLPDRIYFKDLHSRYLRISRALAKQFKLTDPRLAHGKTDFDFFNAEQARTTEQDERQIMESGQPVLNRIDQENLPDGSTAWALTSKLPLRDRRGSIVGNFGILRDITPLKQIQGELATERNLLRSLIDNLPDYIYIKDIRGRYLLDNIAHRRFLGVTREEDVVGRCAADFFPPEIAARVTHDDEVLFATGRPLINREEQMIVREGARRWHVTTKVPLRGHDNVITGLVGIGRDITHRKKAGRRAAPAGQC